jgi:hypothetical protein
VDGLKGVLLVVRFALEIGSLVALAFWGFTTGGWVANVVLGIGAPLLAATVWGLFVSPKARFGSPVRQAAFEAVVFGAATLALIHAGQTTPAIVFAVIALADSVALRLLDAMN